MNAENIFFQAYSGFVLDILIILMWGWGILYTLSKVTKYKRMLIGAFGCLGMFVYHIYQGISNIPNELLVIMPNFTYTSQMKSEAVQHWHNLGLADYSLSLILLFQICIVSALTARSKTEERLVGQDSEENTEPIQEINTEIDNDLDYSDESEDESYHSEEYSAEEYSSEDYAVEESSTVPTSEEYTIEQNSDDYIEAYTESEVSNAEAYVAIDAIEAYNPSASSVSAEEVDEFFDEEEDPLANHQSQEIPQTRIEAPDVDLTKQGFDEEVAKAHTVTSGSGIEIPLEPESDKDFTVSSPLESLDSKNEIDVPDKDEDIEATIACSMEDLVKEAESSQISIPTEPNYEDVDPTISCDMKEIVQDPSFEDETFASLGNDDLEGSEPQEPDSKPSGDNRSLLRNLLPPGSSNKRKS